ncbi:hypothetical protein BZA05DRAFT_389103 [Tricharina praecox]|uniref:uncharacterized protein n=1 Tax=Tricharina praecox TaxID=43433 RepID=UPI00221FC239|nr:uncharacterized protein BZA05DRAFT_389103 [Tricharina praecox]KAI5856622.1 hypothetical protein BZA05DRAFT_389103 [Tricharina praecox]
MSQPPMIALFSNSSCFQHRRESDPMATDSHPPTVPPTAPLASTALTPAAPAAPAATVPSATAPAPPTAARTPYPPPHYPSSHFVLAAGTLCFHPSSRRVLLVSDTSPRGGKTFFLPRGRKDIGETLSSCAIRETLEEGGYHVRLLPTYNATSQPLAAPQLQEQKNTEPFWIALHNLAGRRLYLCHYYLCEVLGAQPEREEDYGKRFVGTHEQNYDADLIGVDEAVGMLSGNAIVMRDGLPRWARDGTEVTWENVGGSTYLEAFLVALGWRTVVEAGWDDD